MQSFNIITPIIRPVQETVVMLRSRPFPPEPRGFREAGTLLRAGYRVHVIAWDRRGEFPGEEVREGVTIRRVRIPSTYNSLAASLVTLPLFWLVSLGMVLRRRPSVVHCADLDTLPVGVMAKRIRGCRVVYDAYEHYAGMVRGSVPAQVADRIDRLERRLSRCADLVIIVWATFRERYSDPVEVPNLPERGEYDAVTPDAVRETRRRLGIRGRLAVCYIGVFMEGRGLDQVMDAVDGLDDVVFILGGFGQEEVRLRERASTIPQVRYLGFVRPEDVPRYVKGCDVMVELLDPGNVNYRMAAPNKLFEAMSAGIPLITSKGTEAARLVEDLGCGYTVEYGDREGLRRLLARLAADREGTRKAGLRGAEALRQRWSPERYERALLERYPGSGRHRWSRPL